MRHILLAAGAILLASCRSGSDKPKPPSPLPEQTAAEPAESPEPVETETRVEMVNVNLHLDPELILHIRHLAGKFLPTRKASHPVSTTNCLILWRSIQVKSVSAWRA